MRDRVWVVVYIIRNKLLWIGKCYKHKHYLGQNCLYFFCVKVLHFFVGALILVFEKNVEADAMRSRAEHDRQGADAFTEDQCLKLTTYLKACNDLRGVALLSLLAQGFRYKEIVSARVSESRDEDGHFAEIIKARDLDPSIYSFKGLRAWIACASLGAGALLFFSKVSNDRPMSQVTLRIW